MHTFCYDCAKPLASETDICPHCGFDGRGYRPEPHQLMPDTVLNGRYRIGRVLGGGGFGITYVGLDTVLNLKVAVKEFYMTGYVNRDNTRSAEMYITGGTSGEYFEKNRERFLDEARTLARFNDEPGIVGVRDCFQANNTAYIVMDFLSGQTLRACLTKSGVLLWSRTYQLMKPVLASLSRIHAHGIIHRDISPDNIMMTDSGAVKLLDFGAAREFSQGDRKSLSIILKHGYAPEEQYRTKGQQGPWTDIYALCATMYHCLTGEVPDDALDRMYSDQVKTPYELGRCQRGVSDVLMKGLALRRLDRWQSIDELVAALERANGMERDVPYFGEPVKAAPKAAPAPKPTPAADPDATVYAGAAKPAADPDATVYAGDPKKTEYAEKPAGILASAKAQNAAKPAADPDATVYAGTPKAPSAAAPKAATAAAPKAAASTPKAAPSAAQKASAPKQAPKTDPAPKAASAASSPFAAPKRLDPVVIPKPASAAPNAASAPKQAPKAAQTAPKAASAAAQKADSAPKAASSAPKSTPFVVTPRYSPFSAPNGAAQGTSAAPEPAVSAPSGTVKRRKGLSWAIIGLLLLGFLLFCSCALLWEVNILDMTWTWYRMDALQGLPVMEVLCILGWPVCFCLTAVLVVAGYFTSAACVIRLNHNSRKAVKTLRIRKRLLTLSWLTDLLCILYGFLLWDAGNAFYVPMYYVSLAGCLLAHSTLMGFLVNAFVGPRPTVKQAGVAAAAAYIANALLMVLADTELGADIVNSTGVVFLLIIVVVHLRLAAMNKKQPAAAKAPAAQKFTVASTPAEETKYSQFTCHSCGQKFRVPAGKGKIKVICPGCKRQYETIT